MVMVVLIITVKIKVKDSLTCWNTWCSWLLEFDHFELDSKTFSYSDSVDQKTTTGRYDILFLVVEKIYISVEHCRIRDDMKTEMFFHILKNVRITSHLEIHTDYAKELKVKLPEGLEYFSGISRWLTSKQLLSMTNYKQLDIWKSSFRNQHASALINTVLGGGLPKLEYCKINIKCCNIDKILEKVEYEKIEDSLWRTWETYDILK